MKYGQLWERLIEYLNRWASAREVPDGIAVTFEQPPGVLRTVEVIMTSDEWADYVSTMYGTGDPRATTLKQQLLATPDGVRYLVFDTYDWWPSETRELAPEDFHPGPGEWVATDDDGNVTDRFADFDERN